MVEICKPLRSGCFPERQTSTLKVRPECERMVIKVREHGPGGPGVRSVERRPIFGPNPATAAGPATGSGTASAEAAAPKKGGMRSAAPQAEAEATAESSEVAAAVEQHKRDRAAHLGALTAALGRVEDAFNSHEFKLRAGVELSREASGDATPDFVHELAYMLGEDGWGLYVVSGFETDEPEKVVRLVRAPRGMRIQAVDMLEELWRALLLCSQAEDVRVQRQTKRADELANKLAGGKGRP
jgi:hypothetical protein